MSKQLTSYAMLTSIRDPRCATFPDIPTLQLEIYIFFLPKSSLLNVKDIACSIPTDMSCVQENM